MVTTTSAVNGDSMLEILDFEPDNVVAFRFGGKITEEEMTEVLSLLKEKMERYEEVYLYEEIESVGGAEFDAMVEKVKFLYQYGIKKITRIAVVTDKKWLQRAVELEDKVFRKIDMKWFGSEDQQQAKAFLLSP